MSIIAEEKVIGALLIDGGAMSKIYNELSAEMFTSEILRAMFIEYQRAYDRGYSLNATLLEQKIRCEQFPTEVTMNVLRDLLQNTETSVTIKADAQVIINDYKAGQLDRILGAIKVNPNNYEEVARSLQMDLELVLGERSNKSKTIAEITEEQMGKYFKPDRPKKISIGFDIIDELLGGFEGGDLIIIGARPSVGKSAFVTQITSYLAKQGKKIGFYNLEMQEKQVYERFLVKESGIPLSRLKNATGFLGEEELRFYQANDTLKRAKNIVLTTGGHSVQQIRSESKHMGYDIIIVDYLQLLTPDKTYSGNRTAEVGEISRKLKELAMELNVPIIALSQMNRLSETKDTKEPTMSELRECGSLEQDASVIMLMWNIDANDKSKKGFKIEKNRQGKLGKVALFFDGDFMTFSELNMTFESLENSSSKDDCPFG